MKIEDLENIRKGYKYRCKNCKKRLIFGTDKIHFHLFATSLDPDNPNIYLYCEECHNDIWGKDFDYEFIIPE